MVEMQWITNEATKERRLYYRCYNGSMDASGALNVANGSWSPWQQVPEKTLDESTWDDIREAGGIANAP